MNIKEIILESYRPSEIIKYKRAGWTIYLSDHLMARAVERGIGPRMKNDLIVAMVSQIPNLEKEIFPGQGFWVQDIKTNSSIFVKRITSRQPDEPYTLRIETAVNEKPLAQAGIPIFKVNAYTGPESSKVMKQMRSFVLRNFGKNVDDVASYLGQKTKSMAGEIGPEIIADPSQSSQRIKPKK